MAGRVFAFARMDGLFATITIFLFLIPAAFVGIGFVRADATGLRYLAVAMLSLYAMVWIFARPREFRLTDRELWIRWALRRKSIDLAEITSAKVVTRKEIYGLLGFAVRVGAGGMFGTFGWLWSRRRGFVPILTSRADRLVALERSNGRMMLLSPAEPDVFVASVQGSIKNTSH